jgi:Domain of unknown function (DUF4276)
MSYDLIFLLEEPSTKIILDEILPKLVPETITYLCIAHQGKQDLAKSIPTKIKAFRSYPTTKFIVLHDQDSNDCKQLKFELLQLCKNAGNPNVLIRILCHELESWYLGDLAAVETAYKMKPNSLSKQQDKKKFRAPDHIGSPKDELRKIVPEYYPGTHSRAIAPHLSLTNNRSHSFQIFLKGIQTLLDSIAAAQ